MGVTAGPSPASSRLRACRVLGAGRLRSRPRPACWSVGPLPDVSIVDPEPMRLTVTRRRAARAWAHRAGRCSDTRRQFGGGTAGEFSSSLHMLAGLYFFQKINFISYVKGSFYAPPNSPIESSPGWCFLRLG